jgi:hypothetical protein
VLNSNKLKAAVEIVATMAAADATVAVAIDLTSVAATMTAVTTVTATATVTVTAATVTAVRTTAIGDCQCHRLLFLLPPAVPLLACYSSVITQLNCTEGIILSAGTAKTIMLPAHAESIILSGPLLRV